MSEESPQETVAEIAQEARSSIELSRDARGVYRWQIKRYGEDFSEAIRIIQEADAELRMLFT